jgi:hypothetical protein
MKEMNESTPSKTPIKIAVLIASLIIIYMVTALPAPKISFNSTLFESAFFSLIMLLFWAGAYLFVRSKHHVTVTVTQDSFNSANQSKPTTTTP